MTTSSSSSLQPEEVLPLIPCPTCGDKVVSFISRAGARFYKCVRKDAGLCKFLRSTDTYLPELTRHGFSQPYVLQHSLAVHPSAPLQQRSRQDHNFVDGSQAEIQPAHVRGQPQMQQPSHPCVASHCCSTDSQRTALLLAGTNFLLVLAMLFFIFVQQSS